MNNPELITYTFQMLDCYGDDFTYSVKAPLRSGLAVLLKWHVTTLPQGKVLKRAKNTSYATPTNNDA